MDGQESKFYKELKVRARYTRPDCARSRLSLLTISLTTRFS